MARPLENAKRDQPSRRFVVAASLPLALAWPGLGLPAGEAESQVTRSPDGRALRMTFSEDFTSFDAAPTGSPRWRTIYGDGRDTGLGKRTLASNGELELYVDPALGAQIGAPQLDPFNIHDGVLEIVARPASPDMTSSLGGHPYISGMISSQPSFAQLYGYFEIQAKLPSGKGLWPALWLLPADLSWPPEIDIMESIGDPYTVYMSLHSSHTPSYTKDVKLDDAGFHTFAVCWDPRAIVWYLDSREVARQPTPPDMTKPMFLIANLAVGGHWPGAPDSSTAFPASFSLNHIRAYQFA